MMPDYQFLNCFVNNCLDNLGKKLTVVGLREGRSGYSKHVTFFSLWGITVL